MKTRRLFSLFLAIIMCFITTIPAFADSRAINSDITEVSIETIDSMTNAQRNAFISQCAAENSGRNRLSDIEKLRLCWYAAAKIMENRFPCASELVQCSVFGTDYTETDGRFSTAIRKSSDYKAWRTTCSDSSMAFSSGDLFYALHKVGIAVVSHTSGGGRVCITDTFDFEFETELGSVLVTLINDAAWLSQQVHALTPIKINISFVDPAI